MSLPLFSTLREMGLPMPQGVLQVGASYGQEMREFLENGIKPACSSSRCASPSSTCRAFCMQLPNFVAVNTLCTDESGKEYTFTWPATAARAAAS